MRFSTIVASLTALVAGVSALDKPLDIKVEKAVDCTRKTVEGELRTIEVYLLDNTNIQLGDKVDVHYRGTLEADGKLQTQSFLISNQLYQLQDLTV
jgi:FK506-binding protein 2